MTGDGKSTRPGSGHAPDAYGNTFGAVYDDWYPLEFAHGAEAVAALARYAGRGEALELGVGTGRIAIPLARRGVPVHGVDVSPVMLERLRAKPGGHLVRTVLADMADPDACDLGRRFTLVYSVFNSLFCIPAQARQTASLAVAARHLAPGGRLVVDHQMPADVAPGISVRHFHAADDEVRFSLVDCDPVTQIMKRRTVAVTDDGVTSYRSVIRYVWPAELDLMAAAAGLVLTARRADWAGTPMRPGSPGCVSVYRHRTHEGDPAG
ncbi:class I SAM-dependent methyltransferase [Streptomyces roseoverticillatus]|uniref:class I SAM-dependent methyltransferase n=1 Tax=Streptomyces roseoverticillatus TaxID=66429 RepID=UPI000693DA53|nr:class I SAM-dependent methyltransferase [Streptomyces roseoverticillatus]